MTHDCVLCSLLIEDCESGVSSTAVSVLLRRNSYVRGLRSDLRRAMMRTDPAAEHSAFG